MNGQVTLTGLQDWQTIQVLEGHTKYVVRVAFNEDATLLASCSYDKSIAVYCRGDGDQWQMLQRCQTRGNPEAIHFIPGSSYLTYSQRDDCHLHYLPLKSDPSNVTSTKELTFNLNENKDEHISFSIVDICMYLY